MELTRDKTLYPKAKHPKSPNEQQLWMDDFQTVTDGGESDGGVPACSRDRCDRRSALQERMNSLLEIHEVRLRGLPGRQLPARRVGVHNAEGPAKSCGAFTWRTGTKSSFRGEAPSRLLLRQIPWRRPRNLPARARGPPNRPGTLPCSPRRRTSCPSSGEFIRSSGRPSLHRPTAPPPIRAASAAARPPRSARRRGGRDHGGRARQ